MNWIIMPVLAGPEMTEAALADCLAQSIPTRILVINQGVEDSFRERLERLSEEYPDRIFVWSHMPPLPSLAATWNRALDFVWETSGTNALVVNNDVRLHPRTVELLDGVMGHTEALFVSAVGVTAEQFDPVAPIDDRWLTPPDEEGWGHPNNPGGPDFSCYLISKEGHQKYRFDEAFTPAFCEDLDAHRRYMLGGDGDKIFSVNLPFLHLSSQTLKQVGDEKRLAINRQIETGSRAHYARKWGGSVNREIFYSPFLNDVEASKIWKDRCGPTTPELQAWYRTKNLAPISTELVRMEELLKDTIDARGEQVAAPNRIAETEV